VPAWTSADIPDLTGRTAIVTGANSGLGLQTALELARHGACVVLAVRDEARGATARGVIRQTAPAAEVLVRQLDLADLASVRSFAGVLAEACDDVDILVNNAGLMAVPRATTADGFERQLGTNHLGHFALTGLLLPLLLAGAGARVVTVSSGVAQMGAMRFDDLQGERRYQRWRAYAQSKLANQLFAYELDRRARAAKVALTSVAAHPGYAATNLQSTSASGNPIGEAMMSIGNALFAQSDAAGALPQLYAATAPDVLGGEYYGPSSWFGLRGSPTRVAAPSQARDLAAAALLWTTSEELTGVTYPGLDPA
jgi:NAD(P)-dependent dehydrogenase (short-subunit alcohol dehydrogenase family)